MSSFLAFKISGKIILISVGGIMKKHPRPFISQMNSDWFDFEKRSNSNQFLMMKTLKRILGEAAHEGKN